MHEDRGRVLIIAGSDPGGGAGVQADIKTVTALGGYAATAITAITVQNTLGVSVVHPLDAALVEAQARAVLDDIGADAIKTGMLGDVAIVEAVARLIADSGIQAVIDPVMIAKGGASLLEPRAVEALRGLLIPHAAVLTPNAPEAEALTGIVVADEEGQRRAADALLAMGAGAVLMKGGHIPGDRVVDLLVTPVSHARYESGRIATRHTHGTGCTLASGVATGLAQGLGLERSVERARDYLLQAIRRAPGFGAGHGPIDHAWPVRDAEAVNAADEDLEQRLTAILRASPRVMTVLTTVRRQAPPDWRLFSGGVYQTVWNTLTSRDVDYGIKDYDIGYFDPDTTWDAEDKVIKAVAVALPPPLDTLVEVRNQARVHLWFADRFGGEDYPPLSTTDEALGRFLCPAFSVGVRLEADDHISIAAPFGLEDVFALRLRPNPARPFQAEGSERVVASAAARWPQLTVERP